MFDITKDLTSGRALSDYASEYTRGTAERDVCAHCLCEVLVWRKRSGGTSTHLFADSWHVRGTHGSFAVVLLTGEQRVAFHAGAQAVADTSWGHYQGQGYSV